MKLFDFSKEGPGLDPDAPAKTGFALFLDILKREFWNMMKLNFLFLLASIPIFTAGAAYGAVCSVMMKMIDDQPVDAVADFKTAFGENWKQSSLIYLIALAFVSITAISLQYYYQLYPPVAYLVLGIVLVVVMLHNYALPLSIIADVPLMAIYKNLFTMACLAPKTALLTLGATIATFFVAVMLFPLSTGYMLLFGVAFAAYVHSFLAHQIVYQWLALPQNPFEKKENL